MIVSNFASATLTAILTQALKVHALLHINRERHAHNVLRAHFALFANGSAVEVQLGDAGTLGSKPPDTRICGSRSIASRCFELQYPLRSGGAAPKLAKGQLNLNHIAHMSTNSRTAIRRLQHNVGRSLSSTHYCIAWTAVWIHCAGGSWGRGRG